MLEMLEMEMMKLDMVEFEGYGVGDGVGDGGDGGIFKWRDGGVCCFVIRLFCIFIRSSFFFFFFFPVLSFSHSFHSSFLSFFFLFFHLSTRRFSTRAPTQRPRTQTQKRTSTSIEPRDENTNLFVCLFFLIDRAVGNWRENRCRERKRRECGCVFCFVSSGKMFFR